LRTQEPEQFDRLEFLPGEECQVDYGEGALTRHPHSGRYRRPRLFIMTLRYSRRSYRQVVWKSSSEVWARLHEQAFRYFRGAVSYCVLDNLREGVITPDIYEPQLNRVYGVMLAHYGVVADPARVRDRNRMGSVESAIQHTQATALKANAGSPTRARTWDPRIDMASVVKADGAPDRQEYYRRGLEILPRRNADRPKPALPFLTEG
jgi:transposase